MQVLSVVLHSKKAHKGIINEFPSEIHHTETDRFGKITVVLYRFDGIFSGAQIAYIKQHFGVVTLLETFEFRIHENNAKLIHCFEREFDGYLINSLTDESTRVITYTVAVENLQEFAFKMMLVGGAYEVMVRSLNK